MNIDKEINNLVNYTMKMGELVLDNLQLAMSTYYHYDEETANKIIMNDLKFPKKIDANNDQRELDASIVLLNVIKICLTKDINQRPSIDQIEKALSM